MANLNNKERQNKIFKIQLKVTKYTTENIFNTSILDNIRTKHNKIIL